MYIYVSFSNKKEKGQNLFDEIRTLKGNAQIEKQHLNDEGQSLLESLTTKSCKGYENAFEESLFFEGKKIRVGVYAIITREDEILMTTTKAGSQTILNLPGGGVDHNEGFATALKRECLEELDCEIEIGDMFYSSKVLYINPEFPDFYMFNLYFMVNLKELPNLAIHNAKWFPRSTMPFEDMLPIDREFVQNNICLFS